MKLPQRITDLLKSGKQAYSRKTHVLPRLRQLRQAESWSEDQLDAFRLDRVRRIVAHAYNSTRFYRQSLDSAGISPNDIRSWKDFSKLPTITRDVLNRDLSELISSAFPAGKIHFSTTGGSTGLPTRFARDNACRYIKKSAELRFDAWAGGGAKDRKLYYWPALADFAAGAARSAESRHVARQTTLTLFAGKLNELVMNEHRTALRKFRPRMLRAFPGALTEFAKYLMARGDTSHEIAGIITVGELLLPHQRTLFETLFNCPVFNCYVSREVGNIACECEHHAGMHVADDMVHVEILSPSHSGVGEIVVTDLWNMGMPLIRYHIQDAGCWIDQPCGCGRPFRLMGLDAARLSGFMVSPLDGSLISSSALTHYLLALGPALSRVKLIQTGTASLHVQIAGSEENGAGVANHIRSSLTRIFGSVLKIGIEYCDELPTLPSGKYSFFERRF